MLLCVYLRMRDLCPTANGELLSGQSGGDGDAAQQRDQQPLLKVVHGNVLGGEALMQEDHVWALELQSACCCGYPCLVLCHWSSFCACHATKKPFVFVVHSCCTCPVCYAFSAP